MNGDVNLTNMKIKSTLFDSLPVPFSLAFGQIGKIHLKIPVWGMFKSPLVIEISDVFALVTPKHVNEWNEAVEIKSYQSSNQAMLEQYEVFSQSAETLKQKDPTSIDKLVAKILDNIQITLNNVYVRYEDSYSAPNHGSGTFIIGILLKQFAAFTTGADWKEAVMSID
jgi:vacuolar protein sorting-associated protein 13A/C